MKNQRSKVSKRKSARWKHVLSHNIRVKENGLENNFYEKLNPNFDFSWNEGLNPISNYLVNISQFSERNFWVNWLQATFFNLFTALQSWLDQRPGLSSSYLSYTFSGDFKSDGVMTRHSILTSFHLIYHTCFISED